MDFKWAGDDPLRWHLWNLIVHVANSCLVYLLAMGLLHKRFAATVTALVFALHGSRPEVVSWMAARFDLLAGFFLLLSLVALDRYLGKRESRWYLVMMCCAVLALLSKEAAYCLPFLVVGFIPFKGRKTRRSILRAAGVQFAVCVVMVLYRFWVIRGIGGYRASGSEAAILQLNVVHMIKGLFFRQWSFLFFPINWSVDIGAWVKGSIILMLAVMVGFLIWSKARWHLLLTAIAFVLTAALPVQHLLLIAADLAGARVLYLPVLGVALFWGLMVQGCRQLHVRVVLTVGLLLFQLIALQHNLAIWRRVAFLSQENCLAIGTELSRDPRPIVVRELPGTWHGVFFLNNGFPQCVEINSHEPAARIYTEREGEFSGRHPRIFHWDDRTERLEEVTSLKQESRQYRGP